MNKGLGLTGWCYLIALAAVLVMLAGCGGGGDEEEAPPEAQITQRDASIQPVPCNKTNCL